MQSREMDPNRGRSGRGVPQLETLEGRCCPSAVSLRGHTLLITADSPNSLVTVRDGGHGTVTATVTDRAGHRSVLTGRDVQRIEIHATGGKDRIDYQLTDVLTTSEQIDLDLGKGQNQTNLNFSKGIAAPRLSINVHGGQKGYDEVDAVFGTIRNTQLDFLARYGNGQNRLRADLNGDVTGSAKVNFDVLGGQLFDGLNLRAHANVGAAAQLILHANGGLGKDTVHVDYWGRVDGKLTVLAEGGQEDDWVESNVWLTPGSKGILDARVNGGTGHDLLVLKVHDQGSRLKSEKAVLDGKGGDSQAVHTANVRVYNAKD
jgi:hypothetical protein